MTNDPTRDLPAVDDDESGAPETPLTDPVPVDEDADETESPGDESREHVPGG
jgi:hypothetical protein